MLHLVQSVEGRVTPAGIEACAELLGISEADVSGVATFYTMYKRRPVGEYQVGVCTTALCAIMGGDEVLSRLHDHLGVGNDETTADGKITLEHIECNAACDFAPVMMVNWEFFDNTTPERAVEVVDALRSGAEVTATRGARVCGWKQAERVLAGFPDGRADEGPSAGEPSLLGLKIAQQNGWTAPAGNRVRTSISPRGNRMPDPLTPVLTANWGDERAWSYANYIRRGGYEALRKALTLPPSDVVGMVKDSGLRGRGGAGFPTGMKWSFIPQDNPKPKYLVVNADESEPGTCKDIPLMMASPHTLVEGVIISAYAIRAAYAFIYVRGEVLHVVRRLQQAVREAYSAGYAGKNILGTGYDLEIVVHAGAGAYICGEETALLDSLEGRRGQPRLRPPFPAVAGLYASPTVINNVESISSVPGIIANGADWFASMGTEKSKGMTIYSLSGHVANPGQFEAPLGITLRQLLDLAGGIREGHELKFWTPGGSSTPILTAEHLDVPLDYEGVASVKSMLGTKALQCFDETTSVVRTVLRWTEFYKHESCGKCTPCREGTWWLVQILSRLEAGHGEEGDIEKLLDLCENILGRSFCALGDGATSPISSAIKFFRDEFEAGMHTPAWELFPYERSTIFVRDTAGVQA